MSSDRGPAPCASAGVSLPAAIMVALLLALGLGSLVAFDPLLASRLSRGWWQSFWMDQVPARLALLLAGLVVVAGIAIRSIGQARDVRIVFVVTMLVAAQVNGFGVGPIDTFDVAALSFLMIWLALHLSGHPALREVHITLPVLLTLFFLALQFMHLPVQNPVKWVVGLLVLFKVLVVPLLMVNMLNERWLVERWIRTFRWVALLSAVVGIGQFLAAYLGIFEFTLIGDIQEAHKPTPIGFIMRASGLAFTAQHYSAFLLLAIPFWLMHASRARGRTRLRDGAVITVLVIGLVASWNFTAMTGLLVAIALFPVARWPTRSLQILLAYGALLVVAYYAGLLELMYDLLLGDKGVMKGVSQRLFLFERGMEKVWRDPIFGVGYRGMAEFSGNYWGRPVHNAYLQAWAELGLFAAALFTVTLIGLLTVMFVLSGQMRGRDGDAPAATAVGLAAFMVVCINEPNFDNLNTWLTVGLAAAMLHLSQRGKWRGADA